MCVVTYSHIQVEDTPALRYTVETLKTFWTAKKCCRSFNRQHCQEGLQLANNANSLMVIIKKYGVPEKIENGKNIL